MKFVSTRKDKTPTSFEDAVFTGLAPDGGLFHPLETPDLSALFDSFDERTPFQQIATEITAALFPDELPLQTARDISSKAFPFEPKLTKMEDRIYLLELFHGPSCAFKDFGASYLATIMEEFLKKEKRNAVILTATSGDTGSAVARAFYKKEQIEVVILYPSGRVSPLQEKQLTTVGENVKALEVKGTFDDCQKMVKAAFTSPRLRERLPLTSANSINLGRLLPQSFYYMFAHSRLKEATPNIYFTVPSGNFGNLTSGVLAWTWGLNIKRFIAATNINDVVPEYLTTGEYVPRTSQKTYSNAMDVGDPSNFERLEAVFNHDSAEMGKMIKGKVVTDEETLQTIRSVYNEKNIFIDPHTAVGYHASKQLKSEIDDRGFAIATLSTAHPGKFMEIVEEATGENVPLPPQLSSVLSLEKQSIPVENTAEALSEFLLDTYG